MHAQKPVWNPYLGRGHCPASSRRVVISGYRLQWTVEDSVEGVEARANLTFQHVW